jgi:hypothetical protein
MRFKMRSEDDVTSFGAVGHGVDVRQAFPLVEQQGWFKQLKRIRNHHQPIP